MTLPAAVALAAGRALQTEVTACAALGGGCVSPAWRVELGDGRTVFLKLRPAGAGADLLVQEALGLRRLRETAAILVPDVLAVADDWLVLEWLEPGGGGPRAWKRLGRQLAELHRCSSAAYGWESDNYIGPLPQSNSESASWPEFWSSRRLRPQLERARHFFDAATLRQFDRLLEEELGGRLAGAEADGASLLHGDLWSGNVHMTRDAPAVIDPAPSFSHREVDLAMADLFGGFDPAFFAAYEEAWPLLPGSVRRRPVYQLYYLLVHVNLFGGGYVAGTARALQKALA